MITDAVDWQPSWMWCIILNQHSSTTSNTSTATLMNTMHHPPLMDHGCLFHHSSWTTSCKIDLYTCIYNHITMLFLSKPFCIFFCRTSSAIIVYRVAVSNGLIPSSDVLSQVLGCLRLPHDNSLKSNFIENMGISCEISQHPNINSLFEGFGEYDIRAFSILEVIMSSSINNASFNIWRY